MESQRRWGLDRFDNARLTTIGIQIIPGPFLLRCLATNINVVTTLQATVTNSDISHAFSNDELRYIEARKVLRGCFLTFKPSIQCRAEYPPQCWQPDHMPVISLSCPVNHDCEVPSPLSCSKPPHGPCAPRTSLRPELAHLRPAQSQGRHTMYKAEQKKHYRSLASGG